MGDHRGGAGVVSPYPLFPGVGEPRWWAGGILFQICEKTDFSGRRDLGRLALKSASEW